MALSRPVLWTARSRSGRKFQNPLICKVFATDEDKLHKAEAGTLEHWSSEEEHSYRSVDHIKIPSVFNEFIEVSSNLDALALFFARLLSGSQQSYNRITVIPYHL